MLDGITDTMHMNLGKLQEMVRGGTGKPGMLQSMGSQRVRHDWVTEQQQYCFETSLTLEQHPLLFYSTRDTSGNSGASQHESKFPQV